MPGDAASIVNALFGTIGSFLDSGSLEATHQGSDDCRWNGGCASGGDGFCYYHFVWNLAELITNEAGTEWYGSRAAVAWTVRDRVNRFSTIDCGMFPGANGACTSICPDPTYCSLQRAYCCVIHSGAFRDSHVTVSQENLWLAYRVIEGHTPDQVSDFVPPGAAFCTLGVCNSSLVCSTRGDIYSYAPDGPIFFYGNYATGFRCRGFQKGPGLIEVSSACNVVAEETCGDSGDGLGSDNCYGRATRNRLWYAGPEFSGGTANGDARIVSPGASAYKVPGFKDPGGKEFVVQVRLDTPGSANVHVKMFNSSLSIVHDFGTQTVTSTSYTNLTYTSDVIVTGSYRISILNEGPGVIVVREVTGRD